MEKLRRRFSADIGAWFRKAAVEEGRSRRSLARGLCVAADLANAKGKLCLASARRALPYLAADLDGELPAARETPDDPAVDIVPEIALDKEEFFVTRMDVCPGRCAGRHAAGMKAMTAFAAVDLQNSSAQIAVFVEARLEVASCNTCDLSLKLGSSCALGLRTQWRDPQ